MSQPTLRSAQSFESGSEFPSPSPVPEPPVHGSDAMNSAIQAADHIVGVGLGGAGGLAVGAVIGAIAGPAGVAAGAIAGAVAGGLAGEALAESIDQVLIPGSEARRRAASAKSEPSLPE